MTTDSLIATARARFDHEAARKTLKEKYQGKLTFASQGGMWYASPELLTVLAACPGPSAVILDAYENPVKVETAMLRDEVRMRWQEQMNAWLVEYEELSKKR